MKNGWLASPSHAANIFDPNFRFIGVGIACDATHAFFVAQYRS